jgi:hypothetical protein
MKDQQAFTRMVGAGFTLVLALGLGSGTDDDQAAAAPAQTAAHNGPPAKVGGMNPFGTIKPLRFGVVIFDKSGRVTSFQSDTGGTNT